MPDGDIIHNKLLQLFQEPYKWFCEGKATSEECARITIKKLRRSIEIKGNIPIVLAKRMGECMDRAIKNSGDSRVLNRANLSREFDRLVQQWEVLTQYFPSLDDMVDRCALAENLLPAEMQHRLILLYRTYVTEWDAVEFQIATGLINRCAQGTSDRYLAATRQS